MHCVSLQGRTYHFRRRVPKDLQARFGKRELFRSLSTDRKREAYYLASLLNLASDRLFALAREDEKLTLEDLAAAARHWLATPMWQRRLSVLDEMLPGELKRDRERLPQEMLTPSDLEIESFGSAKAVRQMEAAAALESAGYEPTNENISAMGPALEAGVREHVDRRYAQVFRTAGQSDNHAVLDPFMDQAETHLKESDQAGQTIKQARATFRLWQELHGNRPYSEYTRKDASKFRNTLLLLPRLHGKAKKYTGLILDIVELVRSEDDALQKAAASKGTEFTPIQKLTEKTVKRHFSAMSGYVEWCKNEGHLPEDAVNIFYRHKFKKKNPARFERDMWQLDEIQRLFRTPVWTGCDCGDQVHAKMGKEIVRDFRFWVPLIGVYHGMRLEEICQLRLTDIKEHAESGVAYFDVVPWASRLKNIEAKREVAIHEELIKIGLLQHRDSLAARGEYLLFPELQQKGADSKFSVEVSKWFTRYRKAVGLYREKLDFHSFRHSTETFLMNTDVKETWIDWLLGHKSQQKAGEGRKRYLKSIFLKNLKATVDQLDLGLDLKHLYVADR